jgi:ABC-type Mn2+/Zn2+ transport systems, permease components
MALVVLNLVGGFHALGTLMAVGIMILRAATARFVAANISGLVIVAALVAVLSSFCGLLLSYHYSLPSGQAIIHVAGIFYGLGQIVGPVGGLISRGLPRPQVQN